MADLSIIKTLFVGDVEYQINGKYWGGKTIADIKTINGESIFIEGEYDDGNIVTSPITFGEAENSAILDGEIELSEVSYRNRALSQSSMAIGVGSVAGLKGWYYRFIDFDKNTLYLTEIQPSKQLNFAFEEEIVLGYEPDDILSISTNTHYVNALKVISVEGNKIVVDNIPFKDVDVPSSSGTNRTDIFSVYCLAKPDAGKSNLGIGAVAQGVLTHSLNIGTHSEGVSTLALGQSSHVEGKLSEAIGGCSHVEGYSNVAYADNSHAEGVNNFVEKTANGAHVEGRNNNVSAIAAHVEGENNIINESASLSHTEGSGHTLNASNSHAEGSKNIIEMSASNGHVEGSENTISGVQSHAEGLSTIASGAQSHSEGQQTTASGKNSHAEGFNTISEGENSHAEGVRTEAGYVSHSEGYETKASGRFSHAEGNATYVGKEDKEPPTASNTTELGYAAHVEGQSTVAIGNSSHAEGLKTKTAALGAHSEGGATSALGQYSHAEGYSTITNNTAEHAGGKFNKSVQSDDASQATQFSIGIGTSDTNRKNAFEVKANGDIYINGLTLDLAALLSTSDTDDDVNEVWKEIIGE